ncbi:hypothetical protein DLNHIDIE_02278 [Acidithiobacillus thiooxidans ATCC 19377]|uniref:Serine O-acetyltransferase n=1 Tax=Acidithiobacillus thiooxidans ATCC 19377 TaxID=637390 RepID=A0A543Q7R3_ACITH|nr:hypothetical protein DLNHIDIE_02278 [Acidithiobacillus thiooxidans ATCC 19377]
MKILNLTGISLLDYIKRQVSNFFPDGNTSEFEIIDRYLDESIARYIFCISKIKVWESEKLDVLHSSQYCTFLYYLSNTIWRQEKAKNICTKLFLLNKLLNGIDCFYEIELPEVFFIGHSIGIVLAKATYGNYLVIYQNSTVGKNFGVAPVIEEEVVLFPHTAIIGRSLIKRGSIISQGVSIINKETKCNKIVFNGRDGNLVFKDKKRIIIDDYFIL